LVRFSDFGEPWTGPLVRFKMVRFWFSRGLNHEPDRCVQCLSSRGRGGAASNTVHGIWAREDGKEGRQGGGKGAKHGSSKPPTLPECACMLSKLGSGVCAVSSMRSLHTSSTTVKSCDARSEILRIYFEGLHVGCECGEGLCGERVILSSGGLFNEGQ
jgi:hypothetical protein